MLVPPQGPEPETFARSRHRVQRQVYGVWPVPDTDCGPRQGGGDGSFATDSPAALDRKQPVGGVVDVEDFSVW
jgi:hypothetical protein